MQGISDFIGALNTAISGGTGTFSNFVGVLIDILKSNRDSNTAANATPTPYANLEETANAELEKALTAFEQKVIPKARTLYTPEFVSQLEAHFAKAKQSIPKLRKTAINLIFGNEGAYDTNKNIDTLATLLGNVGKVAPAHYNELFVAWAKAGARGAEEHPTVDINDVETTGVPNTGDRGFIGFLENEWNKLIESDHLGVLDREKLHAASK